MFVLRQVQELSVEETAQCLDIKPETVKTRLHRARALLRRALFEQIDPVLPQALPFHVPRCDRVVSAVLARIAGGNLSERWTPLLPTGRSQNHVDGSDSAAASLSDPQIANVAVTAQTRFMWSAASTRSSTPRTTR